MAAPTYCGLLFVLTLLVVIQKDGVAASGQNKSRKQETTNSLCENFKCNNSGTCYVRGNRATCRCVDGFLGRRCDKTKLCKHIKCQNGGTCKVGWFYARCDCPPGFRGKLCDKRSKYYSKCAKVRCRNGGVCRAKRDKVMCACFGPFYGRSCEKRMRISRCDRFRCLNGGTCQVYRRKPKCICRPNYFGKRCQRKNRNVNVTCENFRCYNGGQCKMVKSRPTCICPPAFDGNACKIRVEYGIHPSMKGDGYIRLPKERLNVELFTLKIVFRPEDIGGLLLFTSKFESYFFSVTLEQYRVLIRSNSGVGVSELIPLNIVQMREWNTLTIIKKNGETQARLNYGDVVSKTDSAAKIAWYDGIYLGGYPKFRYIARKVRSDEGFYGCIKEIQINDIQIVFSLQHQHNAYVKRWNSYKPTLLHFQKKWKEFVKSFNYLIIARRLAFCEVPCFDTTCLNGGQCVEKISSFKYPLCICLPGYTGASCKKYSPVEIPHFSSKSSLELPVPKKADITEIKVVMKASSLYGLILHLGYLHLGYPLPHAHEFFTLALEDGYVVFKIVVGRKNKQVKSPDRVNPNKWTMVRTQLSGIKGYLKVSGQAFKKFDGLGKDTNITQTITGNSFYLGRNPFINGSELDKAQRSFTGCVHLVEINGESIDFSGPGVSGINVANCSMCDRLNEPCRGGQCIPGENGSYTCGCRVPLSNTQCKDGQSLHFTGRNYLRYKDQELLDKLSNDIQLEIRTTCPDGLIFWSGNIDKQTPDLMQNTTDFMALGFQDGELWFFYDLGSGEYQIKYNESRLFDGNWHFIKVIRSGKYASLVIDHNKYLEEISPDGESLDTYFFYLGGVPDKRLHTPGRFHSSFIGDIRETNLKLGLSLNFLQHSHGYPYKCHKKR
ncbi:pikachurin-like [Plakobranchus ocellatus]|uniref:Pikachurin-like n=1 Tax=Plakobranchus ocellatus TaxID=259542 RepID=A0AAV4CZH8_9GAST|nr:pikachurin-like [Plakobranchus ocellatus]